MMLNNLVRLIYNIVVDGVLVALRMEWLESDFVMFFAHGVHGLLMMVDNILVIVAMNRLFVMVVNVNRFLVVVCGLMVNRIVVA